MHRTHLAVQCPSAVSGLRGGIAAAVREPSTPGPTHEMTRAGSRAGEAMEYRCSHSALCRPAGRQPRLSTRRRSGHGWVGHVTRPATVAWQRTNAGP
eukprot:scaffold676_cov115-Isochrysis_galbana.AAC.20